MTYQSWQVTLVSMLLRRAQHYVTQEAAIIITPCTAIYDSIFGVQVCLILCSKFSAIAVLSGRQPDVLITTFLNTTVFLCSV